MAADLKPCPFCGGDAELDTRQGYAQFPPNGKHGTRVTVYCRDCGADLGVCREDVPSIEAEQVTEMWNRRAPAAEVGDLAALVRQLAQSLRKSAPGHDLANRAVDYLVRKGLQGSPLRDGVTPTAPAKPAAWLHYDANAIEGEFPWVLMVNRDHPLIQTKTERVVLFAAGVAPCDGGKQG